MSEGWKILLIVLGFIVLVGGIVGFITFCEWAISVNKARRKLNSLLDHLGFKVEDEAKMALLETKEEVK